MDYSRLTQAEIRRLAKYYLDARERLYRTIIESKGVGTKTYANTVLRQLDKELDSLLKHSTEFINTSIPKEYQAALDDIYGYYKRNNLLMLSPRNFALLHADRLYMIQREAQYAIAQGLAAVGRQVQRYVNTAMDDALRRMGLEQTMLKEASGGTADQMAESMLRQLRDEGFFTVQYGEGAGKRFVPADIYASMVARSTTREAGNMARLTQLTANGYDLVKMTEHYPTCEVCAPLQGRVYSISGEDDRFPALYEHISEQYCNIHPNCRHSIVPWVESMRSPEEVEEALKKAKEPFVDSRSEEERQLYKKQQDQNRQWRNELYQYERYKARLGDDAPKTLEAFRRIKRAGEQEWMALEQKYRAVKDMPCSVAKGSKSGKMQGKYPASQKQIDKLASTKLKNIRFSSRLVYNEKLKEYGKTHWIYGKKGLSGESKIIGVRLIQIGKQTKPGSKELMDTMIHEELEARIGTQRYSKYAKLQGYSDDEIDTRHEYIQAVINRYFRMKGWTNEF